MSKQPLKMLRDGWKMHSDYLRFDNIILIGFLWLVQAAGLGEQQVDQLVGF